MKPLAIALLGLSALTINVYADNQANMSEQTTKQSMSVADKNQIESDAFLKANKMKPGVMTLSDGLQYKIIKPGKGNQPADGDVVTVHYEGKLVDGTLFDSSYKRGEPTSFPVNGVITGWVEALKLMKPGATWELFIPPSLAYGEQGMPPAIGPNQALIFKVELLKINKS